MANAAFNLTANGGVEAESGTVTVAAGERILVRFTTRMTSGDTFLKIVSNGVTSRISIDAVEAWATDAPLAGSVCSVVLVPLDKNPVTVAQARSSIVTRLISAMRTTMGRVSSHAPISPV